MIRLIRLYVILFCAPLLSIKPEGFFAEKRYICSDAFLNYADFFISSPYNRKPIYSPSNMPLVSFGPSDVFDGAVIYVSSYCIDYFFNYVYPQLKTKFILLTHASGGPVPGQYKSHLDNNLLIAWFGQNGDLIGHPKFYNIPIGIQNSVWCPNNTAIIDKIIGLLKKGAIKKKSLLYMNFATNTNPQARSSVEKYFSNKPFCTKATRKPFKDYMMEMAQFKFVISPHGRFLDCHRTWEALLVGCFPVVKTSTLDPLYKDLPVVIVNDWKEVNRPFLEKKYNEMIKKHYNRDKLYLAYWINQIEVIKKNT